MLDAGYQGENFVLCALRLERKEKKKGGVSGRGWRVFSQSLLQGWPLRPTAGGKGGSSGKPRKKGRTGGTAEI